MFKNLSIHVNFPSVTFIKINPYIFRRIVKGLAFLHFKQQLENPQMELLAQLVTSCIFL